uniref:Uncharacterized protein n=1 Tax=Arundo donax TaxID=35708 RepID=A0A0A8ZQM9_ARUDO
MSCCCGSFLEEFPKKRS